MLLKNLWLLNRGLTLVDRVWFLNKRSSFSYRLCEFLGLERFERSVHCQGIFLKIDGGHFLCIYIYFGHIHYHLIPLPWFLPILSPSSIATSSRSHIKGLILFEPRPIIISWCLAPIERFLRILIPSSPSGDLKGLTFKLLSFVVRSPRASRGIVCLV